MPDNLIECLKGMSLEKLREAASAIDESMDKLKEQGCLIPEPRDKEALGLILEELKKARKKHPVWPEDKVRKVGIMTEETLEAMKAVLDLTALEDGFAAVSPILGQELLKGLEELRMEVAQTGAMAIRVLSSLAVPRRGRARVEWKDTGVQADRIFQEGPLSGSADYPDDEVFFYVEDEEGLKRLCPPNNGEDFRVLSYEEIL